MPRILDVALKFASFVYLIFQFLVVGVALLPAVLLVRACWRPDAPWLIALALGVGYLVFGLVFLLLTVIIKHLMLFRSREGDYPFLSAYAIR